MEILRFSCRQFSNQNISNEKLMVSKIVQLTTETIKRRYSNLHNSRYYQFRALFHYLSLKVNTRGPSFVHLRLLSDYEWDRWD